MMNCFATTSFPQPVSPRNKTVEFEDDTISTNFFSSEVASQLPLIMSFIIKGNNVRKMTIMILKKKLKKKIFLSN